MPKRPQGQKRPADLVRNIVQVMRIATGEDVEDVPPKSAKPYRKPRARMMRSISMRSFNCSWLQSPAAITLCRSACASSSCAMVISLTAIGLWPFQGPLKKRSRTNGSSVLEWERGIYDVGSQPQMRGRASGEKRQLFGAIGDVPIQDNSLFTRCH
jgi:hypothetical protein